MARAADIQDRQVAADPPISMVAIACHPVARRRGVDLPQAVADLLRVAMPRHLRKAQRLQRDQVLRVIIRTRPYTETGRAAL
jgi:hypothetical protein